MVPLVRSAGGSHQWLAIAFLGLSWFLASGRLAAPGGDFPGAAVDNLVVRKGDTAVLRVPDWFELGGNLKVHLVPPPIVDTDTFHYPRLFQALSNLALDTSRDGAATAALGNLCQGLTTLTGNNSFPEFHLTLPSGSGKPSRLVLALQALSKTSRFL
ncbi:hypothetical protein BTVI_95604 [Pitangus sulphuratus]|nr:hypothetical protein BTVI_95604 [Pitangus sulphuratus]